MIKTKLKKIIRDTADKRYIKKIDISFIDGTGLYNHACHLNAVNKARDGSSCAVVDVVVIDDKSVTAHYINMQSDGAYVDYTSAGTGLVLITGLCDLFRLPSGLISQAR